MQPAAERVVSSSLTLQRDRCARTLSTHWKLASLAIQWLWLVLHSQALWSGRALSDQNHSARSSFHLRSRLLSRFQEIHARAAHLPPACRCAGIRILYAPSDVLTIERKHDRKTLEVPPSWHCGWHIIYPRRRTRYGFIRKLDATS